MRRPSSRMSRNFHVSAWAGKNPKNPRTGSGRAKVHGMQMALNFWPCLACEVSKSSICLYYVWKMLYHFCVESGKNFHRLYKHVGLMCKAIFSTNYNMHFPTKSFRILLLSKRFFAGSFQKLVYNANFFT